MSGKPYDSAGFMGGWDAARGSVMDEGAHRSAMRDMIKRARTANDIQTITRLVKQGTRLPGDFSVDGNGVITVYDGSTLGFDEIRMIAEWAPWVLKSPDDVRNGRPDSPEEVAERHAALEALKRGDSL